MAASRKVAIAVSALFAMSATPNQADTFAPSHSCSKPFKPFEFTSRSEYEMFMFEVENYKQCIGDFVEEQEDAVRLHQEAAEEAIEEWNSFVNLELR